MTSKERSILMSNAQKLSPIVHIGKEGITPSLTESVNEAIAKHELIKIEINKNCFEEYKELGNTLAERTKSQLVQIIGRKMVLYRAAKDPKDRKYNI